MSDERSHKIEKYQTKLNEATDPTKRNVYARKIAKHIGEKVISIDENDILNYDFSSAVVNTTKIEAIGFGQLESMHRMVPVKFDRRVPKSNDVVIKIEYSGICRSDWHYLLNEWKPEMPLIPGHEIAGIVVRVGSGVDKYHIGDKVGVGPTIDSCRHCPRCLDDHQQYCENGPTSAYNSRERLETDTGRPTGRRTYGGYSNVIVVNQDYVVRIPNNIPLDQAAPLMCAGATTYSPLRQMGIGHGSTVAVVGIGGLGHVAIKLARAMGAKVTAITTTEWKVLDAARLGAESVIYMPDYLNKGVTLRPVDQFDLIIDTIPDDHDLEPYISMLKFAGTLWILGVFGKMELDTNAMAGKNRIVRGSAIGGIDETQQMLDFCSQHKIGADVEKINIRQVNETINVLRNKEVRYRFVIDFQDF